MHVMLTPNAKLGRNNNLVFIMKLIMDFKKLCMKRVFFSRTPLRTPPGVRNGITYGVRNE